MNIKNQTFVLVPEVKKTLTEKEKEKELVYEQKITVEHLKKFSKLAVTKAQKLAEDLKTVEKLKDKHIVTIVNFLPEDLDDLRVLMSNERVDLSTDDKERIIKAVKEALK